MKKKIIILSSFLIGAIFVLVIFTTSQQSMINNEAIQVEELIVYGDKNMNRVAKQFSDQNNLTSFGKNFWRKTYNGKSPTHELLKVATKDLVQHKMIKQLATELEIAHSQTFGQEKKEWQDQKSSLTLWQFLDAKDQQLQDQIKEKLMEKEKPTQKELRQAFEQLDDKYKKTGYFVEAIEIPTFSGKQAELEKIAEAISPNLSYEETLLEWQNKLPNLVIESYQLKSAEIQKEDIYSLSVGEILSEKAVGTVVKGYHENQYFYIFNKEGGQLLQFEEAPQFGKNAYINTRYKEKLATYQQATKVDLLEKDREKFFQNYQNKNS